MDEVGSASLRCIIYFLCVYGVTSFICPDFIKYFNNYHNNNLYSLHENVDIKIVKEHTIKFINIINRKHMLQIYKLYLQT